MKKVNLPVVYGLMPIKDYDKVISNIVINNDRVVGYAVSKCYLISEEKRYNLDGTIEQSYRVVFPFNEVFLDEKTPDSLNEMEEYQFTSALTNQVFDDVEDANKACNSLNLACIFAEKKIREKKGKWNQYVFDFEKKKKSIEEESDMIMSEMPIKKYIYERD